MEGSNRSLIDQYADLKVQVDDLTKQLEAMRKLILEQYTLGEHAGDENVITITSQSQVRIDGEALKGYLPAETLAACQKTISFPKVTVKRRAV